MDDPPNDAGETQGASEKSANAVGFQDDAFCFRLSHPTLSNDLNRP